MAINTTPREMPTGDGNPTAGAINRGNCPTSQQTNKAYSTLRAALALRGHALHRLDSADGESTYWVERWGLVRHLLTLHDVAQFLVQIGGRL